MAKARHFLNSKALRLLFCSLVLPYLTYCTEVWGNTYRSSVEPLYRLQKRAIRIINNAGYLEHTNKLFLKSEILKIYDIIEFHTVQFLYKARNNILPNHLQELFKDRDGGYSLREHFNFKVQKSRTTTKSFCIKINGVRLWNRLSLELKQCPNITHFKKEYRKIIFNKYREEGA